MLLVGSLLAGGGAVQAEIVRQLCRFPDGERRVVSQALGSAFLLSVDNCEELPSTAADEGRVEVVVEGAMERMADAVIRTPPAISAPRDTEIRFAIRDIVAPPPTVVAAVAWAPAAAPARVGLLLPATPVYGALVPLEYQRLIARSAQNHGVDPQIVEAVMYVESRFRADARSAKGALGLMQLMPQTALSGCGVPSARLFDPATNIECGARYLAELTATFAGRLDLALAAYNAGPGAVMRHGGRIPPFAETQAYVERVLQRVRSAR